jgi:hypothetical protein
MNPDDTASSWETSWEIEFPAADRQHLLHALVVRDLVHGISVDLDLEKTQSILAVDYLAGDDHAGGVYHLLLVADATGPVHAEALQALTEEVLEELVVEAEHLVARCELLDSMSLDEVVFQQVQEDEERWDLVVPDWLAPDGAEVPFGFRSVISATGSHWPSDAQLDAHGRVVLVPHQGVAHLYGIPFPVDGDGELPVIP